MPLHLVLHTIYFFCNPTHPCNCIFVFIHSKREKEDTTPPYSISPEHLSTSPGEGSTFLMAMEIQKLHNHIHILHNHNIQSMLKSNNGFAMAICPGPPLKHWSPWLSSRHHYMVTSDPQYSYLTILTIHLL